VEIIIVLLVLLLTVILFITEKLPVDFVSVGAAILLIISGIINMQEGFSGFSNEATITIASMFIISAALTRTGVVIYLGRIVIKLFSKKFRFAAAGTFGLAGIISAFINNTPVVAVFLPLMTQVARAIKISASKLLLPLSYASIFGGITTLIGSSSNIVVSSVAARNGELPFTMFEFTHLAVIFFIIGIIYIVFIGIPLIPERRDESDLTNMFGLGEYLTEIVLKADSESVNLPIKESKLVKSIGFDILEVIRNEERVVLPSPYFILRANDTLRVRGSIEKIKEAMENAGFRIKPGSKWHDQDLISEDVVLVEAIIAPNSLLEGRNLKESDFRFRFGGTVLAIRHRGKTMHEKISSTRLQSGDALLMEISKDRLAALKERKIFVFLSEIEPPTFRKIQMLISVMISGLVVISVALGILPIAVAAITGAALLILLNIVTLEQAYRAIDWPVIMLLAGSLAIGVAMEKSGTASFMANTIISTVGTMSPVIILSAFYLLTLVLTEAMSNNATAALITPIAIFTANSIGVDPRPFLIAVMFATSLAFMSPIGYQTHLLVYNAGRYKYIDFVKVGTPLNIICWIMATILIPIFFPFY
jgi:di/tricarboxylate transporter